MSFYAPERRTGLGGRFASWAQWRDPSLARSAAPSRLVWVRSPYGVEVAYTSWAQFRYCQRFPEECSLRDAEYGVAFEVVTERERLL